eukprot:8512026-Karenia_brevis.AAC.1
MATLRRNGVHGRRNGVFAAVSVELECRLCWGFRSCCRCWCCCPGDCDRFLAAAGAAGNLYLIQALTRTLNLGYTLGG